MIFTRQIIVNVNYVSLINNEMLLLLTVMNHQVNRMIIITLISFVRKLKYKKCLILKEIVLRFMIINLKNISSEILLLCY